MSKITRTSVATRKDAIGFAMAVALLGPGVIALHTWAAQNPPHLVVPHAGAIAQTNP